MKEIAVRAGTSISTVSLVLNDRASTVRISETTRQQVLDAARVLGYTPNMAARRLRSGQVGAHPLVIGVLMPRDERLTITVPAVGTIHDTLDAWSRETGAAPPEVIIEMYTGGEISAVESLAHNARYNGALLFNTLPEDDAFLAAQGPLPVPLVLMQRSVAGQNWVNTDNHAMGRQVAAHLHGLGHRDIAVVMPAIASAAQTARREGFTAFGDEEARQATRERDIVRGTFSEQGGYDAVRRLLAGRREGGLPLPTALFVTTDRMAVGGLHALKEAGLRVPEDVAVIGYDDDPVAAHTDPPLTTVDAATGASAAWATRALLDLIQGRETGPLTRLLAGRLVVRASSGNARATA